MQIIWYLHIAPNMSVLVNIDIYYAQYIYIKGAEPAENKYFYLFLRPPHALRPALATRQLSHGKCRGKGGVGDTIRWHQGCRTKTTNLVQPSHKTIFWAFLARASRFSSCILAMVNQGLMAAGLSKAITVGPGLIWKKDICGRVYAQSLTR